MRTLPLPGPRTCRARAVTDLGSAGPKAILGFGAPRNCDLFGRLCKKRESIPLLRVVPPEKSILCGADFGSTITLDQGFPTF